MTAVLLAMALISAPAPVEGDFDRDGRTDRAEVIGGANGAHQLIVRRASGGSVVVADLKADDLPNFYLTKIAPGQVSARCAEASSACRQTLTLSGETLSFGTREASQAVAVWRGDRFMVAWVSD